MWFLLRGCEDTMNWWWMDGEGLAGSFERSSCPPSHRQAPGLLCLKGEVMEPGSTGSCREVKFPTCSPGWKQEESEGLQERRVPRRKADGPTLGKISNKIFSLWSQCWGRWNHFCLSPYSSYISTYSYSKRWVTPITRLYSEHMWSHSAFLELAFTILLGILTYPVSNLTPK